MSILQAIIMGIVQGVTEFAPISSSGHLILVPWMFGWDFVNDASFNKTFDVALHVGTLIGAVAYFRTDIVLYARAFFRSIKARSISGAEQKMAWALVIGTIPGAIAGASFSGFIEDKMGAPLLIAIMLTVFALVLYLVDRMARSDRSIEDVTLRDGVILGVAQAVALQPGVSRSGVTITAGRLLGLDRASAARFSFLLSLPIIAGAGLYKGIDIIQDPSMLEGMVAPFIAGMASAAVSGFLVIWFLLSYLRKHNFALFLWYRVAVTLVVLVMILTNFRPATI